MLEQLKPCVIDVELGFDASVELNLKSNKVLKKKVMISANKMLAHIPFTGNKMGSVKIPMTTKTIPRESEIAVACLSDSIDWNKVAVIILMPINIGAMK